MTDGARENLIEMFRQLGTNARDRDEQARYYESMRFHIARRSAEQVERMERERGLR